jgi:hypothetical protein
LSVLRLRDEELYWRESAGEVIVLDAEASRYLAANASAAILWQRLVDGAPRHELAAALREAYALSPEVAERDVAAFLDDLASRGLLASETPPGS